MWPHCILRTTARSLIITLFPEGGLRPRRFAQGHLLVSDAAGADTRYSDSKSRSLFTPRVSLGVVVYFLPTPGMEGPDVRGAPGVSAQCCSVGGRVIICSPFGVCRGGREGG